MDWSNYFIVLLLVCAVKVSADCSLSLKKDFLARPSPVYIQNGGFLAPNASTGEILLRRSETILVACPGDKRKIVVGNQTTSYDVLEAHCIINDTFRVDRWIGRFGDIKCNTQPWFSSEEIDQCGGGNKLYRVGYKVKNTFHKLYEACFDPDVLETVYVQHDLAPSSKYIQTSGASSRPQFSEGGLYGKVSMADLYKIKNQEDRINAVLGSASNQFITKSEYLTRGHLAPRADFSFQSEQRASFHYINTAPQWRRANAGAWAAVEDGIRRRVNDLGRPVKVYTGPLGVSSLKSHPFYLSVDKNNNGVVPVPMYFYKLVYDPRSKNAVAFITINSSAHNATNAKALCDSVCEEYSWLKWRGDNVCCHYEDIAGITRLPPLDVEGLFLL